MFLLPCLPASEPGAGLSACPLPLPATLSRQTEVPLSPDLHEVWGGPRPRLHLPWLQRVGHFQKAVGLMPCEVIGVTVPLSHAGKPATPVNLEGKSIKPKRIFLGLVSLWICLAKILICLGSTVFLFSISPFWNGNVYPMPVPVLHFESKKFVQFHRATARKQFVSG